MNAGGGAFTWVRRVPTPTAYGSPGPWALSSLFTESGDWKENMRSALVVSEDVEAETEGGVMARYWYGCACDGLVRSIEIAATIDFFPYIGDTDVYVRASLRHVMRRGRALGLIPEAE